jgi:hypothetical protein
MANKFQYSLAHKAYTVSGVSGGTMNADYPASNITSLHRPRLVARSSGTTAPVFTLSFGSSTTVGAFSIENVNFSSLRIQNSGGTSFTQDFDTSGVDVYDGRRKAVCIPSSTFTAPGAVLTPSGLDSGESYYKIGAFGVWPTFATLTKNPSLPYERKPVREVEKVDYGSGNRELGLASPVHIEFTVFTLIPNTDDAIRQEWWTIVRQADDELILWYENPSPTNITRMYHVYKTGDAAVQLDAGGIERITGLVLREVV